MQPVVSVVIPTRDRLRYLQEAVASVQAQTFDRWELLIVDDASEDQTRDWLRSITDTRIIVLRRDQHVERSAARNLGLYEAQGEYVIFLDDDDRFRPRALETLVEVLRRSRDVAVVCGARIEFDERGHRRRSRYVRTPQLRPLWPEVLAGWVAGPGEVMFRTELLRSIGGWDESLTTIEDWELLLRASYRLGPVFMHPDPVREWRRHAAQWRPHDVRDAISRVEQSFFRSLSSRERAIGEGAARLRVLFRAAQLRLHTEGEPGAALHLFVAAYRSAPSVARSPVFRLRFARGVAQALLARVGGPQAHRALESARRAAIRTLRQAPGRSFELKVVEDSAIRDEQPEG
jgi:glycosyltransferase involved in cell wall biosynthesis